MDTLSLPETVVSYICKLQNAETLQLSFEILDYQDRKTVVLTWKDSDLFVQKPCYVPRKHKSPSQLRHDRNRRNAYLQSTVHVDSDLTSTAEHNTTRAEQQTLPVVNTSAPQGAICASVETVISTPSENVPNVTSSGVLTRNMRKNSTSALSTPTDNSKPSKKNNKQSPNKLLFTQAAKEVLCRYCHKQFRTRDKDMFMCKSCNSKKHHMLTKPPIYHL